MHLPSANCGVIQKFMRNLIKASILIFGVLPASAWLLIYIYVLFTFDISPGGEFYAVLILLGSVVGTIGFWLSMLLKFHSLLECKVVSFMILIGVTTMASIYWVDFEELKVLSEFIITPIIFALFSILYIFDRFYV